MENIRFYPTETKQSGIGPLMPIHSERFGYFGYIYVTLNHESYQSLAFPALFISISAFLFQDLLKINMNSLNPTTLKPFSHVQWSFPLNIPRWQTTNPLSDRSGKQSACVASGWGCTKGWHSWRWTDRFRAWLLSGACRSVYDTRNTSWHTRLIVRQTDPGHSSEPKHGAQITISPGVKSD